MKKNKLCYKEVKDHNILNTYYKAISNLCFINIEYRSEEHTSDTV